MAVGLPITQAEVNAQAGALALILNDTLDKIGKFRAWLDTKSEGDLTALGYTTGEVAVLKSAFTDLDALRAVYLGAATRTPAYDHRAFAQQLYRYGY